MKESVISIDKFGKPKIIDGIESYYTLIVRLILMNPGTIQSHPNMGVGLVSNWRYCDESRLPDLQKEIYNQISKYIPELLITEVNVFYNQKYLIINLVMQNETIVLQTEDFKELKLVDILS